MRSGEEPGFAQGRGDFMGFGLGIAFAKFFRDIEILRQAALAQAAAAAKPTYTASKGQTPQVIAKALGHRDGGQAIARANSLRVDQKLAAGVVLVIPKIEPVADPAETRFNSAVATHKKPAGATDSPALVADVRKGKTLEQIGAARGLSSAQVTAAIEASGLQVKTTEPTGNNGDVKTVEIVDRGTGKVIASHYEDYQHGGTTSKITGTDGKEITQTKYGDGASSRTVSDAKTGETTTRVADPKTGKVTETVVDKDKRLKQTITEKAGDGTRKTEKLSFDGYTLATAPDGNATLLRDADGTQLAIKAGTPELSLAKTLLEVNPNSSDPAKAKEGSIVKTTIDAMLMGQSLPDLDAAAQTRSKETKAAIEKYGAGQATQPTQPKAPSGKEWVQVGGLWLDPEVAKAMAVENTAAARLIETQAKISQANAQLTVYALDPAYGTAMERATKSLDKALAPHDLRWERPKPVGTLEQARQQLAAADKQVVAASGTTKEYAEAERLTGEAVTKVGQLPAPIATGGTSVSAPGYNKGMAIVERNAKRAEVDALFAEANTHTAKGDKSFADYLVGMKQQKFDATKPGTPDHTQAKQELDHALSQQEQAGKNVRAAEVYETYYEANKQLTALQQTAEGTKQKIVAEHRQKNPDLYDWDKEHRTYGGDYLGKIQKQEVVEDAKDHQLYLETTYEHGDPKRVQLTFARNDKNVRGELKDRALNQEWQTVVEGPANLCGQGSLEGAQRAVISAGEEIKTIEIKDLDLEITELDAAIPELKKARDDAVAKYGAGTPEAPSGINAVNASTTKGKETPGVNGELVRIQMDGKWTWAHPEVANAQLALDTATAQKNSAERAREEASLARNRLNFALSQPIKLLVDAGSDAHGKSTEYAYLDKRRDQALGEYQLKMQDLYDAGYTDQFKATKVDAGLDTTVAGAFGLNAGKDAETIGKVAGEIRDIGGDSVQYKIVPMFHVDPNQGSQQTALIAVKEGGGKVYYVDVTGKKFESLRDFQDNNSQFGEGGRLVVPRSLDMKRGRDSTIPLEVVNARNFTVVEKAVDPVVGTVTSVAAAASFIPPFTPVAAPIAMGGGAYLGGRAVAKQVNHLQHGGEWGDKESLMNLGSAASSFIPAAAGGLRTFGMFRAVPEMSRVQALRGSIGALRPNTPLALKAAEYMSNGGMLNRTARVLDWASLGIGLPMTAVSVHDIAVHGSEMKGIDLFNAITGVATGTVGTVFGTRGLLMTRPRKGNSEDNDTTPMPQSQQLANVGNVRPSMSGGDRMPGAWNDFVQFANSQPLPRSLSAAGRDKDPIALWKAYQRHLGNDPDIAPGPELYDISRLANPASSNLLQGGSGAKPAIGKITYNKPEITAHTTPEEMGAFLPGQLARLDPRELQNLTPAQAAGIRKAAKANLNDAQIAALEIAKKRRDQHTTEPKHKDPASSGRNTGSPSVPIGKKISSIINSNTSHLPDQVESTFVYRGDTRGPEEILSAGFDFHPDGQLSASGAISTSLSAREAREFAQTTKGGWVYTIAAKIATSDIIQSQPGNATRGLDPYEIGHTRPIPVEDILAARQVGADGRFYGPPIYNQKFKNRDLLPDAAAEPAKPVITLQTKPKDIKKLSSEEVAQLTPDDLQLLRRRQAKAVNAQRLETDEHWSALLYAQRRRGVNEKRKEFLAVMGERTPPRLRTGLIKASVLGTNIVSETLNRSTGSTVISGAIGGPSASALLGVRSTGSKSAWWLNNHGVQRAFGYAMLGNEARALKKADSVLRLTGSTGTGKPSEAQKQLLYSTLKTLSALGKTYQEARNALPKSDQALLPKTNIDKMRHPSASEEMILKKMDKLVDYKVPKDVDLENVAAAQARIVELSTTDMEALGPAYEQYVRTHDARKAYSDLYDFLLTKFEHDAVKGTVDLKKAEKLVGSSMSPETHWGFVFKAGALAAPVNALAAVMLSKHSVDLNLVQWLSQDAGNLLRALPAVLIQTAYLKSVQRVADIKLKGSDATPEELVQLKDAETLKDKMNKSSDESSVKYSLPGLLLLGGVAASLPDGGFKAGLYGLQAMGGVGWYLAQRPPSWLKMPSGANETLRVVSLTTSLGVPMYMLIDSLLQESKDTSNNKSNLDVIITFTKLDQLLKWAFGDDPSQAPAPVPSNTSPSTPAPARTQPPMTISPTPGPAKTPPTVKTPPLTASTQPLTPQGGVRAVKFNTKPEPGSVEAEIDFQHRRAIVMLDPAYAGTKKRAQYEAAGLSSSVFAWENLRSSAQDMLNLLAMDARENDMARSA
jgi:hypothetical protein